MSGVTEDFDKRIGRVKTKHHAMSKGYMLRVEKNGLIRIDAKRKSRSSLRPILAILCIGLLFKAIVYANYGPDKYASKLDLLRSGTAFEQAGAFLLHPGQATQAVAGIIDGILR